MLKIYNTLSHAVEEFKAINPPKVGMYSCGPTVYDYQHIGHMRTYVGSDILVRTLKANGFNVLHVMNITDVGHLVSDADTGEDKMEKGAKKFGMSVWDIAKKFETQFKDSCKVLNINLPKDLMHATDYIKDQIELVRKLEEKGFTYKTADGIYFDTSKFPDYFKLSRQNPEELKGGVRVDLGDKKNITDFALWKFSPKDEKRQMEWESPWGLGFPGWHIECSAMGMKALGESLDIHTGGIDHINIHHTNEIAQSEAATGRTFVKYWVHFNYLLVNGEKMSKSLNNFYTVQDVMKKGLDPIALRYLYLQTHYRQEMNFTWESLEAAQTALNKLRNDYLKLKEGTLDQDFKSKFMDSVSEDLNMSKALSLIWEYLKNDPNKTTINFADEILGLGLSGYRKVEVEIPQEVKKLLEERKILRNEKKYEESDRIREKILEMGYKVEDE
jgi:cysteinyl-tRNA synthetase